MYNDKTRDSKSYIDCGCQRSIKYGGDKRPNLQEKMYLDALKVKTQPKAAMTIRIMFKNIDFQMGMVARHPNSVKQLGNLHVLTYILRFGRLLILDFYMIYSLYSIPPPNQTQSLSNSIHNYIVPRTTPFSATLLRLLLFSQTSLPLHRVSFHSSDLCFDKHKPTRFV
ncbi:hypothetical protein L1887_25970 [Cichorium endivia]|nr:hypothetical protein L1887_25970 [Cichorium endivia]